MYPRNGNRLSPFTLRKAALRGVLLGTLGSAAAGLVGMTLGAVLCLADGLPWACSGEWGLRGALGGLVSGALIGVFSGLHHVAEGSPRPKRPPPASGKSPPTDGPASFIRPAAALDRNGIRPHA